MAEHIIPNQGTSAVRSPRIVVQLNRPIPVDSVVEVFRGVTSIGVATRESPTQYSIHDINVTVATHSYTAELTVDGNILTTEPYTITIPSDINQGWSSVILPDNSGVEPTGPFIANASSGGNIAFTEINELWLGVTVPLLPADVVTWTSTWVPGGTGGVDTSPVLTAVPPSGDNPWRCHITDLAEENEPFYGYHKTGELIIEMFLNGVSTGQLLRLVMSSGNEQMDYIQWGIGTRAVPSIATLTFTGGAYSGPESGLTGQGTFTVTVLNESDEPRYLKIHSVANKNLEDEGLPYSIPLIEGIDWAKVTSSGVTTAHFYADGGVTDLGTQTIDNDPNSAFAQLVANHLYSGGIPSVDRYIVMLAQPGASFSVETVFGGPANEGVIDGYWRARCASMYTENGVNSTTIAKLVAINLKETLHSNNQYNISLDNNGSPITNPIGQWTILGFDESPLPETSGIFQRVGSDSYFRIIPVVNHRLMLTGPTEDDRIRLRFTSSVISPASIRVNLQSYNAIDDRGTFEIYVDGTLLTSGVSDGVNSPVITLELTIGTQVDIVLASSIAGTGAANEFYLGIDYFGTQVINLPG